MQAPRKATCGNGRKSMNGKRNIDATRTTAFTMKLIAAALLVATASANSTGLLVRRSKCPGRESNPHVLTDNGF